MLTHTSTLLIGYRAPILGVFDKLTGKSKGVIKFEVDGVQSLAAQQINRVVAHPFMNVAITAHENKFIRFFDVNAGKHTRAMIAHTDAVSCLQVVGSTNLLVSGGHDGSIRCWDLRKFQCVHEQPAHRRKYDESVMALSHHGALPLLASSGADGIIKVFETAHMF